MLHFFLSVASKSVPLRPNQDVYKRQAQKSELKFSKDGKFKIVQFTDVHFKYGNRASDIALERINQVLDDERPDLVIFTGDVVYSAPADSGMLQVLEPVVKRKLPFVVTFGNHDNEQGMTREQLYDKMCIRDRLKRSIWKLLVKLLLTKARRNQ